MGQCVSGNQPEPVNAAEDHAESSNAAELRAVAAENIPHLISLRKIKKATKKFKERIGEGGSAIVYKGKLKDNQLVAVKRLKPTGWRIAEYNCEVAMLTRLSHPNIINLIGFCLHDSEKFRRVERIIVYEHMPLRSLHDYLHARRVGEATLDWSTRMMIVAGVAKGLSYLHNEAEPRVIFADLKPADVLLDQGYIPKICDFGVALNIPAHSQDSIVQINRLDRRMTSPYWEPEAVMNGRLSPRTDVYSFGVLLLETVIRILPRKQRQIRFVDDQLVGNPANFVRLVDSELAGQFDEGEVIKAMGLASLCMQKNANARPAMSDVVRGMNNLAGEANAVWPEEFDEAPAE